ncbi:MAG: beta-lactamase family protein [Fusicatenibacter sp.]|nr:beta-lactamase family protein [Fusicatenibacter sp.]
MKLERIFWDFISLANDRQLKIEGIAVADETRVLLEHRFTPDLPRNIYSHTKSYVSTAVGLAISDGVLSLEDYLVDAFPECVPDQPGKGLEKIQLKHLLTMSSGFGHPYLMGADRRAGIGACDYVSYMMSQKVEEEPGSRFEYSSADSILAGRMVEQATGMQLGEFLYGRIFSFLDQGWPIWENDYQGHPVGCGGLYLSLTEMMKLGQLYLAEGRWKGEQLLDPSWVREASTKKIDTDVEPTSDPWRCGYGYQFWMSPYPDSYRADGAYGQISTVMPKQGLVVAVQCPETGDFEQVKRALHEELLLPLTV